MVDCRSGVVHACPEGFLTSHDSMQTVRMMVVTDSVEDSEMVAQAIRSASQHGIQLEHGRPNPDRGNCAI